VGPDVGAGQTPGTDQEVTMDSPKDDDRDLSSAASDVANTRRRDGEQRVLF
jgi:bromodomain-containing protein 8